MAAPDRRRKKLQHDALDPRARLDRLRSECLVEQRSQPRVLRRIGKDRPLPQGFAQLVHLGPLLRG